MVATGAGSEAKECPVAASGPRAETNQPACLHLYVCVHVDLGLEKQPTSQSNHTIRMNRGLS